MKTKILLSGACALALGAQGATVALAARRRTSGGQ